jgi:hypothetical protein
MTIDILYFDGCPHYEPTVELVRSIVNELGVDATICRIPVDSREAAESAEFVGSPTVRIDGVDIDPEARDQRDYGLTCRRYGSSGVPPREMIEAALAGSGGE